MSSYDVVTQESDTIYRTSPSRTGKMMAIMLGICIVGGVIFFAMWDYWISEPAPIVAIMAGVPAEVTPPAKQTGMTITHDLTFVEADDFITMAFNALPGEEGNNPTIEMDIGDKAVFNVESTGISFHAFAVTKETEGIAGVIPGTEVGSMAKPLTNGQGGTSEFIPSKEGTYYYICTIPGHRAQGMEGQIIVSAVVTAEDEPPVAPAEASAPTGVSHSFDMDMVESDDFRTFGFVALEGEEGANPEIRVNSGDEVTVSVVNKGVSFHAFGVVAKPTDFNNVLWDSSIAAPVNPLKGGEEGDVTFVAGAPGTYYYICTVPGHALQGMQGSFIVE